jgi:hypothetical protein
MTTESAAREAPVIQPRAPQSRRIIRVAQALLERGQYSWIWVVSSCPYCGKPHDHYGGSLNHPPRLYSEQLFPAHCDRTDRRRFAIRNRVTALWYTLAAPRTIPPEVPA